MSAVPSDSPTLPMLFESIYGRLKELSVMYMRSQPAGHTLQATAVVHEAFVKLAERETTEFNGEEHFMATAATVLRSVMVDHAPPAARPASTAAAPADSAPTSSSRSIRPSRCVARMLDLSVATAERDWRLARARLEKECDVSRRTGGLPGRRRVISACCRCSGVRPDFMAGKGALML